MRTDERWGNLSFLMNKSGRVYNKSEHRMTFEGILTLLFNSLSKEADSEWLFIAESIVRAHQHSSGAISDQNELIGKSRRLTRQYFPKGSDFTHITQKDINQAMNKLNNRPR